MVKRQREGFTSVTGHNSDRNYSCSNTGEFPQQCDTKSDREWPNSHVMQYRVDSAHRRDLAQNELSQLTTGLDIPTDITRMLAQRVECPVAHPPNYHCQFCVDLMGKPYTTCWTGGMNMQGDTVGDCHCTGHDARVPWPTGPDGYRQPENTTGIDLFDLDSRNFHETGGSVSDSWTIAHGPINKQSPFTWSRGVVSTEFYRRFSEEARIFTTVCETNRPNYQKARIPLEHGLNIAAWRRQLSDYHDKRLVDYLEFGFPLGYISMEPPEQNTRNHASSTNYPCHVEKYLAKELGHGSLIGPFRGRPTDKTHMNPIMSRPKKDSSERRIILNLSFAPNNQSVNTGIPKSAFEGELIKTVLPAPQHLANELLKTGRHAYIYGIDLARAYRQLRIDPGDWELMGLNWKGMWYLDKTPAFGVRLAVHFCCRVTNAVCSITRRRGHPLFAYIDDFIGWKQNRALAHQAFRDNRAVLCDLGL